MRLTNALAMIKGGNGAAEKVAAAPVPAQAPSSSDAAADALSAAIKEATAPEALSTKTASQAAPVEDLAKLAADVSMAEHEATIKEANQYGAAVADGFMVRLAQYQTAAAKVAGATPAAETTKFASTDDSFEKFATENIDLVREAHDLGYASTKTELTKLADAAYVQGYNATVEQIYKVACDVFVGGFTDTLKLLETSAR